MGGFLNDAAGGSRRAVLALRQVGQGHGSIDLPPVRLISALHLLLLRHSDPNAAPDGDEHSGGNKRRERREHLSRTTVDFTLYNCIKCFLFKSISVMHYMNYWNEHLKKYMNTNYNSVKVPYKL